MMYAVPLGRVALAVVALLLVALPSGWCFLPFGRGSTDPSWAVTTSKQRATTTARSNLYNLPRMIVFDLDNTIWTPELYQLRKLQRQNLTPVAGKDVKLLEGAVKVLEEIIPSLKHPETGEPPMLAIASRTQSVAWAEDLIDQFGLRDRFQAIEIFPSQKTKHFSRIQQQTRIATQDMMFFDDARDGKYGNCVPVASMGVFCVHCPQGIFTEEIFHRALEHYRMWDRTPNTIVEYDGKLTTNVDRYFSSEDCAVSKISSQTTNGTVYKGIVKMVRPEKRYGFILYRSAANNKNSRDIFFHFNNIVKDKDGGVSMPQEGEEVTFEIQTDANARGMAVNIIPQKDPEPFSTVQFRCFSMNQPFAALLTNGYKTLETRNGTMFTQYAEGTQLLLHVGQRTYPDGGKHIEIMKENGLNQDEIDRLKTLPPNFSRGKIIAVIELGKTYETSTVERSDPEFERNAVARGEDSGKFVTEIKRVSYLKQPVKQSGAGGVFKVRIPPEVLPDGDWHIPTAVTGEESSREYATISG
ncbi:HAD-SF-IIIC: HAD phosphatase, family IIIC [Nitzschia inconspicua]|uniref:HAD-SF-IIIC: HAD phosphatase, family IIIC n=1 Tax=Nitzschia inconspicua TaxID=303405 RepID=A0A9K3L003_9STRA|nr:HAD-SF-IIIC: HAD phosphatase, family IIIC [Nitzschia inconspicua]